MFRAKALLLFVVGVTVPVLAFAFPFGGQINVVKPCYNNAIYANLGPPKGGPYIWTPSTKTYQFGPPRAVGQWLLGLASAPYYCVISISPVIVWPGTHIDMMGSSGPAAPMTPSPATNFGAGLPTTGSGNGGPPGGTAGNLLITEVYPSVDSTHGTDPLNEWVELYNGTLTPISLAGYFIESVTASSTIPGDITVPSGGFVVLTLSSSTRSLWNIPSNVQVIEIATPLNLSEATGLARLRNPSRGNVFDALSWGTNTTVMNPAIPAIVSGHSFARSSLTVDTGGASDWIDRTTPTPGR